VLAGVAVAATADVLLLVVLEAVAAAAVADIAAAITSASALATCVHYSIRTGQITVES
jgi:hypothetical protein